MAAKITIKQIMAMSDDLKAVGSLIDVIRAMQELNVDQRYKLREASRAIDRLNALHDQLTGSEVSIRG